MDEANLALLEEFIREHGLDESDAEGLEVLLSREHEEPRHQIERFLAETGLEPTLLEPLLDLHRDVRSTLVGGRYALQENHEQGAMGEIWIAYDRAVERQVAMKILRPEHVGDADTVSRFQLEIRILTSLQHPSVLPLLDRGVLDGRPWYTMPFVHGHDFGRAVQLAHAEIAQGAPRWDAGAEGWPIIRPLLLGLLSVCRAVAMAHAQGIVHRDLSARNVFVGPHDQHYVLDWGIASWPIVSGADDAAWLRDGVAHHTAGAMGTAAYVAPEQAEGRFDEVDERSDVYSLGALLYHLLSDRPPYHGSWTQVARQVRDGPPPRPGLGWGGRTPVSLSPLRSDGSLHVNPPGQLIEICNQAMDRDRGERYPSAKELASALQAWLDGGSLRRQARSLVQEATDRQSLIDAARSRAVSLRRRSRQMLEALPSWASEEACVEGWALEDRAREAEHRVLQLELETRRHLHAALQLVPSLGIAHEALIDASIAQHCAAEAARDREATYRAEQTLIQLLAELPPESPLRGDAEAYLEGTGQITLCTDPPEVEVELRRYREEARRLQLEDVHVPWSPGALEAAPVPRGSYLLTLRAPGRAEVRCPVHVERQGHWEGLEPVWLPPGGSLSGDEVYVPAGWFLVGGDDAEAYANHPLARLWLGGFVMQRTHVTNLEYVAFLDACSPEERERRVPRERLGAGGEPLFDKVGDRYVLERGGTPLDPSLPVTSVDWHDATAYLAWKGAQDGKPWRLPGDLEWEKAARGADGRIFPWGDHLLSSRCNLFDSQDGPMNPVAVNDPRYWDTDASPCGVRGLAGNVREWCHDGGGTWQVSTGRANPPVRARDGGEAVVRGGSWQFGGSSARATSRSFVPLVERHDYLGFRGVYPLAPQPPGSATG